MKYYFDTSAIVKRYHREKGTEKVDEIIEGDSEIYISTLAIAETISAFTRLISGGIISKSKYKRIFEIFFSDVESRYIPVPLSDDLIIKTVEIIERHNLRTLDALHLAVAVDLCPEQECIFVSADRKLLDAAKNEGFETLNPEE